MSVPPNGTGGRVPAWHDSIHHPTPGTRGSMNTPTREDPTMTQPSPESRFAETVAELDRVGILLRETEAALDHVSDRYADAINRMGEFDGRELGPQTNGPQHDAEREALTNDLTTWEQRKENLELQLANVRTWHRQALKDAYDAGIWTH